MSEVGVENKEDIQCWHFGPDYKHDGSPIDCLVCRNDPGWSDIIAYLRQNKQ